MANSVARVVLESLIKLITDEANLLLGVKDQVSLLQGDLGFMNAFVKNSSGKQSENHIVKELVNQIRDVALEAEDVIDTYICEVINHRIRNRLGKLFHSAAHARLLHDVAEKTTKIKNKIENIYHNKEKYDIGRESESSVDVEAEESIHKRRRMVEEDDVVGFNNDTTTLVNQLTTRGSIQREVISIIGMGGLGKTTLARKIYNNTHVMNHFNCCAWVSVSQEYKTNRLLLDILKCIVSISDEIYKKSDEELKIILHDNLKRKRYLVVMDDIWKTQVWDEIRCAFPDDSNGSKILITSREKEVASHASPTPPYFLPFLDNQASWELLCKKVFRGQECPSYLESLGKQLAESCKGLPLSIVVLGGILANKEKSPRIWSKFVGHVNSYLTEDRTRCLDILALSYTHLSHKLKPCFLYFGMFPEDYEIKTRALIKLWIAERLVQQIGNRKVEDVAEDYLEELIDRSLVQVASRRIDRSVGTCRIHDLLRDLCIKESDQEKFLEFRSQANLSSYSNARRLSVHCDSSQYVSWNSTGTCDTSSSARSLLFFCQEYSYQEKQWEWVWRGFKFVRVLKLFDVCSVASFPKEIGKLIFLRHLSISSSGQNSISCPDRIPDYICNLPYLETIDIQLGVVDRVPSFSQKSIWRMKQLRRLSFDSGFTIKPWREKGNDANLCNLQAVRTMMVDRTTALVISKFPNLTQLTLYSGHLIHDESEVAEVLVRLENLGYLQKLKLRGFRSYPNLKLPSTLTMVTLVSSYLYSHLMRMLGNLPNLRHLTVENAATSPLELKVVAGEFLQLQVFEWLSNRIKSLEVEKDAMPNLQHLVIIEHLRGNNTSTSSIHLPDQLWSKRDLQFVKMGVDYSVANALRDKLWKLNCVRDEKAVVVDHWVVGGVGRRDLWELTLNNGCRVSLCQQS